MHNRFRYTLPALPTVVALLVSTYAGALGDTDVTRATLPNGLRVIVVRDTLAPVVATELNYLVGSNETPAGFPGMAHAQEHMMFRGSKGLSAAQLADIVAQVGGDFNADTQQSVTQYFFTVPAENLKLALNVEAIRMRGVLDAPAEWAQERGAIEQEVAADLSNPFYKWYSALLVDAFAGTPYAHDPLGTRPSFRATTVAMLKKFYNQWYAPNNAILVIAGDVDPQNVLAQVRRLFGSIPPRPVPAHPAVHLQPMKAGKIMLDSDLPFAIALVSYRMPGYDSPDYAAGQILGDVLGSQRGNIYGLVPQGKALFASFQGASLSKASIGYAFAGVASSSDASAIAETLKSVVTDYVKNGFPADLVEAAKRRELAQVAYNRDSIAGLADAWSQAVAVEGRNSPEDDVTAIGKVSVDDVNRVAREYLLGDSAIVGVLTPKPAGKAAASQGFGGKESFTSKEAKSVPLPSWAKTALASLSVPASTLSPYDTKLPNGLRLIVQRETTSLTVTVKGEVRHNPFLQTPPSKEGLTTVLNDLFSYGTTSLDRLAFQKALDDIAADESAGTSFSLQVLGSNFDRGMELLSDNVLHPALPPAAFAVVQQQTAGAIAGQMQSPDYLAGRALNQALFPKNDPIQRSATPQTVGALTLSDVANYYSAIFRPDMTTIVVIGDITVEQAKAAVEKYFGAWHSSGAPQNTDLPAVPLNRPATSVVPATGRVQDSVTLKEVIGLTRANDDYYALEVANHVLGGGFYATRLYRDVRQNAGLVYYIDANLDVGKTRSTYTVTYGCDPPKVSKAQALIERDLRAMQLAPATSGEIQKAKALLVRQIPLSESSEARIASGLLSRSLSGLPLDEPIRAAHRYLSVTADQVKTAFARWIRPNAFVQVVEGPNPR